MCPKGPSPSSTFWLGMTLSYQLTFLWQEWMSWSKPSQAPTMGLGKNPLCSSHQSGVWRGKLKEVFRATGPRKISSQSITCLLWRKGCQSVHSLGAGGGRVWEVFLRSLGWVCLCMCAVVCVASTVLPSNRGAGERAWETGDSFIETPLP